MNQINTELEFNELINSDKKVIIDFYADWCGPCKMMAPMFEEASKEVNEVIFAKLNVDQLEAVAEKYEITSIPTLIIFQNGKQLERHAGFINKDGILNLLK